MPSPAVTFQATIGNVTPVQASTIAALAPGGVVVNPNYGVRLSIPSANSGSVYWGTISDVTVSTGCLLPTGGETTINKADFNGDLANLYFIATAASQTITGAAL